MHSPSSQDGDSTLSAQSLDLTFVEVCLLIRSIIHSSTQLQSPADYRIPETGPQGHATRMTHFLIPKVVVVVLT